MAENPQVAELLSEALKAARLPDETSRRHQRRCMDTGMRCGRIWWLRSGLCRWRLSCA